MNNMEKRWKVMEKELLLTIKYNRIEETVIT